MVSVREFLENNFQYMVKKASRALRINNETTLSLLPNVWVRLQAKSPNVADAKKAEAYIISSVFNEVRMSANKEKRTPVERNKHFEVVTFQNPKSIMINKQLSDAVLELGSRGTVMSKIFRMRFVDDMSDEQISEELGMNRETVRSHINSSKRCISVFSSFLSSFNASSRTLNALSFSGTT